MGRRSNAPPEPQARRRRNLPTAFLPSSAAFGIAWVSPTTTTSAPRKTRHKRGVQKLFQLLKERGFIYKGSYTGQYCVSDELYVDAPPGAPCPDCGRLTETVSEENYYFKLSAFERNCWNFTKHIQSLFARKRAAMKSSRFVRGGLKDLSDQPHQLRLGHPCSRRRKACDLRVDGCARQLHHRPWLRQR